MKKNRGFTLVEILAVIILLALIMILVIPAIATFLENAKKESFYLYANSVYEKAVNKYVADENDASRNDVNCSVYKIPDDLDISNSGDYQGWVKVERTAAGSGNYSLSIPLYNDNGLYSVKYCTKYNSDCDPENTSDGDSTYESDYWMVPDGDDGKPQKGTTVNVVRSQDYHLCVMYQYPNASGTMVKSSISCNYVSEEIQNDTYEYKVTLTLKDKERAVEGYILQNNTQNKDENRKSKQGFFNAIDNYRSNNNDPGLPITELVCSGTGNTIGGGGDTITTRPTTSTPTDPSYVNPGEGETTTTRTTQIVTQENHTRQGSYLITGITVTGYDINFTPYHRDYSFTVPNNVTSINVNYTKANNDVGAEVIGADKISVGVNTVIVHAWNDSTQEEVFYYITVSRPRATGNTKVVTTAPVVTTKPVSDTPDPMMASSNAKLSNIVVSGYELSDVFSPEVYSYDIEIDQYINELLIDPILQEQTARYEISGNHNLQEGSKIQITVISQNGYYHNTYTLTVHIKKKKNYSTVIIRTVALGLAVALIVLLTMIKKQKDSNISVKTNKTPEIKQGGIVQPTQINKK